jgi:hypothetical protein
VGLIYDSRFIDNDMDEAFTSRFSCSTDMVYGAVEDLLRAAELPGPGTLGRLTVEQVPAETKWADVATALAATLPTGRGRSRGRKRPRAPVKKTD